MSTLMTKVVYGSFFSAQYDKELDPNYRVNVIHHPYRLIVDAMTLSSWDEIEPIIEKDGSCECWCRIALEKEVVGTKYFESVDPIPIPELSFDKEYVDDLKGKAKELLHIAEKTELGDVSTDDAKTEVDAIATTLTIATVEPRIL